MSDKSITIEKMGISMAMDQWRQHVPEQPKETNVKITDYWLVESSN